MATTLQVGCLLGFSVVVGTSQQNLARFRLFFILSQFWRYLFIFSWFWRHQLAGRLADRFWFSIGSLKMVGSTEIFEEKPRQRFQRFHQIFIYFLPFDGFFVQTQASEQYMTCFRGCTDQLSKNCNGDVEFYSFSLNSFLIYKFYMKSLNWFYTRHGRWLELKVRCFERFGAKCLADFCSMNIWRFDGNWLKYLKI